MSPGGLLYCPILLLAIFACIPLVLHSSEAAPATPVPALAAGGLHGVRHANLHYKRLVQRGSNYTSFSCSGANKSGKSLFRTCIFNNICFRPSQAPGARNGTWTAYRPCERCRPLLYDQASGPLYAFKDVQPGFVYIGLSWYHWALKDKEFFWSPEIAVGTVPPPGSAVRVPGLHYLIQPFTDNLGHTLWEEYLSLYGALRRMNLYDHPVQMMRLKEPCGGLCAKFERMFLPAITPLPSQTLHEYVTNHMRMGDKQVCFEQLLVGGVMPAFEWATDALNYFKEEYIWDLRNTVLRKHGLDPSFTPAQPSLLLSHKKWGSRKLINFDSMLAHLRARYAGIAAVVDAELGAMEPATQFATILNTTLLITPPGGVSTILPFLPTGAHAIIFDYYQGEDFKPTPKEVTDNTNYEKNMSISMEGRLWAYVPYVHTHYYQHFSDKDFRNIPKGWGLRDADQVVDLKRLTAMVDEALQVWSEETGIPLAKPLPSSPNKLGLRRRQRRRMASSSVGDVGRGQAGRARRSRHMHPRRPAHAPRFQGP